MEFCSAHWKEPKRAVINMKKISIIFQPSPTLIFEVPCSKFTENLYPYPRMPWSDFRFHSKKRYGVTSHRPTNILEKKKHRPKFLRGLTSQPMSPQNLSPFRWVVKIFPLPTTRRLVPLKDGTLFARKEKEWQRQSHDHRRICDVIGVLKFQRDTWEIW